MLKGLIPAVVGMTIGTTCAAQAQVNVKFLDFEGRGFIVSNPVSATCAAAGFGFALPYIIVYRHTLDPQPVPDALSFTYDRATQRIESTQGPGFSLNGPTTTRWDSIDTRAALTTDVPSSSNLSIRSGGGGAITKATEDIVISGTINDMFAVAGCTIEFRGALIRRPN